MTDEGIEEAVMRLSQMYGFNFEEAMQRLAGVATVATVATVADVPPVETLIVAADQQEVVITQQQEKQQEEEISQNLYKPSALWSHGENGYHDENEDETSDDEEYSDANTDSGTESNSVDSDMESAERSMIISTSERVRRQQIGCRILSQCLTHGQRVRTAVAVSKCNTQLEGSYDSATKKIAYGGKFYSLNQFAELQIALNMPGRGKNINAWENCMCDINGTFVKMINLPVLSAS